MKKFRFTLQKLYDVKQTEEEQKRIELQEFERELDSLATRLNELMQVFLKEKEEYNQRCLEGISKIELKNYGDYFEYINEEINAQNELISRCNEKIALCRQELLRLMNEQKVLDRIREEQLQEYYAEQQKDNEKEIEDFMQGRI